MAISEDHEGRKCCISTFRRVQSALRWCSAVLRREGPQLPTPGGRPTDLSEGDPVLSSAGLSAPSSPAPPSISLFHHLQDELPLPHGQPVRVLFHAGFCGSTSNEHAWSTRTLKQGLGRVEDRWTLISSGGSQVHRENRSLECTHDIKETTQNNKSYV